MFQIRKRHIQIDNEALDAYLSRVPNHIEVAWKKEGKLFVGKVRYDDNEFATQASNYVDFIRMVSDGLLVSLDIPLDYVDYIYSKRPVFQPSVDELKKLQSMGSGKFRIPSRVAHIADLSPA